MQDNFYLGIKDIDGVDEAWHILNKLFSSDSPILTSQYFELTKARKFDCDGEVSLWLSILDMTMNDWLDYKKNPTSELHKKLTNDIWDWAFKESFTLDRISEAFMLVFRVDPDVFKSKFREWLVKNKVEITK